MLDVVAVAMLVVVPILTYSIYLVRFRRDYQTHKRLQIGLGVALLIAVVLFEIDVRMHGWTHLAFDSPYYETYLFPVLWVHLFFACSTTALWIWTILEALGRFPSPPAPTQYGPRHKRIARFAALGMYATSITGWTFYYMAFMAV